MNAHTNRTAITEPPNEAERAMDRRDLDILSDLHEGHSQSDFARFYGVSKTYVCKLAEARRTA